MSTIVSIDTLKKVVAIERKDGSIREVDFDDLDFSPNIGDEVILFESDDGVLVKLKEKVLGTSLPHSKRALISDMISKIYQRPYGLFSVNKVTYCVLAFFLGSIGAHKFYSGKTAVGLAYLFFSVTGIPTILSLIDFILALGKRADDDGNIWV